MLHTLPHFTRLFMILYAVDRYGESGGTRAIERLYVWKPQIRPLMANLPCTKDSDISSFFLCQAYQDLLSWSVFRSNWTNGFTPSDNWKLVRVHHGPCPFDSFWTYLFLPGLYHPHLHHPIHHTIEFSSVQHIVHESNPQHGGRLDPAWLWPCGMYTSNAKKKLESAGAKNNQNHWPLAFFLLKISENSEGTWNHITNSGLCQKQRRKPFQYTSFWWGVPNFSRCWI